MSHPIGWILLEVAIGLIVAANVATLLVGGGNKALEFALTIAAVAVAVGCEIQRRRARKHHA
jgi:hypothetical protein